MVKSHKERLKFGAEIAFLRSGDKFGHLCFHKSNSERNATVIADESIDAIVVHRKMYESTLADVYNNTKDQLNLMEKSQFFEG